MSGCSVLLSDCVGSSGGEGCSMGAGVCIQTLSICFSGNEAAVAICIKSLFAKRNDGADLD